MNATELKLSQAEATAQARSPQHTNFPEDDLTVWELALPHDMAMRMNLPAWNANIPLYLRTEDWEHLFNECWLQIAVWELILTLNFIAGDNEIRR